MVLSTHDLTIRRMRDTVDEYALFAAWRNQPHVREWWDPDDPPTTMESARVEYGSDVRGPSATRAAIIEVGAIPIGFIQYYPWSAYEPDLAAIDLDVPAGAWGLDIFIGDAQWVGRGIGSRAVRLLSEHLFSDEGATAVAFGVATDNLRARRAYEKAGMVSTIEYLDSDTRHGQRMASVLMVRFADGASR